MKIAKFTTETQSTDPGSPSSDSIAHIGTVSEDGESIQVLDGGGDFTTLESILASDDPIKTVHGLKVVNEQAVESVTLLSPVDRQEVWAAGVTYKKSQTARMEESEAAASCYDQVYNADRPELFFKATPHRVRGHRQPLRIRADATWNVPEPEITLVISPKMKIVGLTVGNDMSSRDIEGENPLYLPQAKCYDQSAGVGPWIKLYDSLPTPDQIGISLEIKREDKVVFGGNITAEAMARQFDDLVSWLGRDTSFPHGVFLMTGTGIVPTSEFTLHPGDWVHITIDGVGTLSNPVVQG